MPEEISPTQLGSRPKLGDFDAVIIGAGMAGASLAYELASHMRVLVLERESQPGYHTTGRSAALFSEIYGNDIVRALSRASRAFLEAPGAGFAEHPLLTPRGTLFFAAAGQIEQLHALHGEVAPRSAVVRWFEADELRGRLPALRPEFAQAGLFEPDASDIDVHALHQGYLRGARQQGATLICDAELESASYVRDRWTVQSRAGQCSAALLVNAAGAWADDLAQMAGAAPLDLAPLRRTALVFEDHQAWDSRNWPLAVDIDEQLYFKPDAGRLLASPADETPSPPCDAQPDEFDVAVLLDRLERMTLLRPKRITGRWAGLRTFAPDRTPVAGFDAHAANFFWLAGQGGYGIQTAPALALLSASLILGKPVPDRLAAQGVTAQGLSARRFERVQPAEN
ncbi:MAG: FAD-dependent oxidoreductase [Proteobacteria bacterium]|nr:FAD-dependent oxidoreductase [Pseudomonadota bacterium]